jgi:hypothetical protein
MKIPHLDGRILRVKCEDIVTPGSYKKIPDEGMPLPKSQFQRGALYIEFDVQFPKPNELDKKTRGALAKLLPAPPTAMDTSGNGGSAVESNGKDSKPRGVTPKSAEGKQSKDGKDAAAAGGGGSGTSSGAEDVIEDVTLTDVNIEEERARFEKQQREAYEEDDERGSGGRQQASCRAQ